MRTRQVERCRFVALARQPAYSPPIDRNVTSAKDTGSRKDLLRIYLAKDGDTLIVLFGGGTKRGQQRDIDQAKALLAEYKARKKAQVKAARPTGPRKR